MDKSTEHIFIINIVSMDHISDNKYFFVLTPNSSSVQKIYFDKTYSDVFSEGSSDSG